MIAAVGFYGLIAGLLILAARQRAGKTPEERRREDQADDNIQGGLR